MDGGAWWAAVHRVAKSRTRLFDFTFTFHVHTLEKEMATYSSVLALRIPGTGEPGGRPSMGSHRVGHDWSDLAAAAAELQKLLPIASSFHCLFLFVLLFSISGKNPYPLFHSPPPTGRKILSLLIVLSSIFWAQKGKKTRAVFLLSLSW